MKDNLGTKLTSIKTNKAIVEVLKMNKKINLPFITLWFARINNKSQIEYALLVNKSQFKLAVVRNKIKRQLRSILITSELKGGLKILLKPNSLYLKKDFAEIKQTIIKSILKYQNGK